jgi:hypothetical protein
MRKKYYGIWAGGNWITQWMTYFMGISKGEKWKTIILI